MHVAAPVAAGLVAGAAFIAVFVVWSDEPPIYRVASMSGTSVTIPEGAALGEGNFEPRNVMIERGEFVEWVNDETVPVSVVVEPACEPRKDRITDIKSYRSEFLMPGESFTCVFREAGEYHIHTEPWPWMQGTVNVAP